MGGGGRIMPASKVKPSKVNPLATSTAHKEKKKRSRVKKLNQMLSKVRVPK